MEPIEYQHMAEYEDRHWWFVGRRNIIEALLKRLPLPRPARVLDAGCGTGGNLAMLSQFGHLSAAEMDEFARHAASTRNVAARMEPIELPGNMPYAGEQFDLIVMSDVLEHIDDDVGALSVLRTRLAPGGCLCVTVPAHPFLWSGHDLANHHKRRYTGRSLREAAVKAGLKPGFISYINCWLFPLIAVVVLAQKIRGMQVHSNFSMPPKWLNALLAGIYSSERLWAGKWRMPVGASLIMSAQAA